MMHSALDTTFEMSLRVLLLLSVTPKAYSADMLALADTLTIYSGHFGITDRNLHGESRYVLDEYDARRELAKEAVKFLTLRGLVTALYDTQGFRYEINADGEEYICGNNSEYALEYRSVAQVIARVINNKTEREIFNLMRKNFKPLAEEFDD